MTIGQRINLKRNLKGMTLAGLSEEANVPKDTLTSWIYRGVHPDIETLCKIADVLECTLDELAGRTVSE